MNKLLLQLLPVFIYSLIGVDSYAATPPDTIRKPLEHRFSKMDLDGDGYVSFDEYKTWHQHWLEWRFQHMDTDSNGYISADEFGSIERMGKKEKIQRERFRQETPLQ